MLQIGKNRECFFDTYLIDTERTTAEFRVHEPTYREDVMVFDKPWEGDGSDYFNLFFDDQYPGVDGKHPEGVYRMYYLGWQTPYGDPENHPWHGIKVCYAESPDGIHWVKPHLGLSAFHGATENNILFGEESENKFDNFMVFRDDNPACPPEQKYKGVARYENAAKGIPLSLFSYFSADGIHFTLGKKITDKGVFDSLNVVFWDAEAKKYRGYIRGFHSPDGAMADTAPNTPRAVRDIRYLESVDFDTWTTPELLDFGECEDVPLYTNVVSPYYRAPQMLIGFPTRYIERREWCPSFDELCGAEKRKSRMKLAEARMGLTVTDCVFMASHDGKHFTRHEDAFMRPTMESGYNWLYGDCYPTRGFVETPSLLPHEAPELSMFVEANHMMGIPTVLQRYALRLDGFVSMHAGGNAEKVLVTKPFCYEGTDLFVNFATSARGGMEFILTCEGKSYSGGDTFGNSLERRITFPEGVVAACAGKEVVLTVRMRDADLYAIHFA